MGFCSGSSKSLHLYSSYSSLCISTHREIVCETAMEIEKFSYHKYQSEIPAAVLRPDNLEAEGPFSSGISFCSTLTNRISGILRQSNRLLRDDESHHCERTRRKQHRTLKIESVNHRDCSQGEASVRQQKQILPIIKIPLAAITLGNIWHARFFHLLSFHIHPAMVFSVPHSFIEISGRLNRCLGSILLDHELQFFPIAFPGAFCLLESFTHKLASSTWTK